MPKYLVSNIVDRRHAKIYGVGAFFDLESSQHGWDEYSQVQVGDSVYVINKNRNVAVEYKVTEIKDDLLLETDPVWGHKVISMQGGNTRVLFGKPLKRIDQEYSAFVKQNKVSNSKINNKTGLMLQGFNCAAFE
ncbi:hypothetical protein K6U64_18090 [Vibrio vulnificus]|uniref:hypothetical protein n=1 Tax=Vibrio vulnificus TaxID=672 RepID=UPI001EEBD3B6|nr:hypothetical protein [Vibrio vulnificus]MCG6264946.1 hypothetical protein [Vibrio vulnificus]